MPLRIRPDVEALTVAYARSRSEVQAAPFGGRVGTALQAFPCATVTLLGGLERVRRHLYWSTIQVDTWGGTKEEARLFAAVLEAVLLEMETVTHARGVVTAVDTLRTYAWLPDETYDPPKPRYSADYQIAHHAHPI